jgi:hypothetical protein
MAWLLQVRLDPEGRWWLLGCLSVLLLVCFDLATLLSWFAYVQSLLP